MTGLPPSISSEGAKQGNRAGKTTVPPPEFSDSPKDGGAPFVVSFMTAQQKVIAQTYGHERPWFIDSTFGLNKYGFSLFTIMVAGPPCGRSKATGFVIGWVITSREDAETTAKWLLQLKRQIPEVKPSCILTDAAQALRNAVTWVFGNAVRHLLCIWHVKKAWRKAAVQKIKDEVVRKDVLDRLFGLQGTNFHKPGKEEDEATVGEVIRNDMECRDESIAF